ncbi:MAG: hypothetical protein M5R36_21685 [Deltaproteobacteria bacterium]|nr:hypothetical protein [Deltaproteobacteria bacterium]
MAKERVDLLARLRDKSRNKALVKSVKQQLHQLKQAGRAVPDRQKRGWKRSALDERMDETNFVTAFDGRGFRLILLLQDRGTGPRLLQAVESDRTGIADFRSSRPTRSKLKDMLKQIEAASADRSETATAEEIFYFLKRAAERNRQRKTQTPEGFVTALSYFEKPKSELDKHPLFAYAKPVELEVPEGRLPGSEKLFADPLCADWSIGDMELRVFQRRLFDELGESPDFRSAKASAIVDETVDRFFDEATRGAFHTRLMDLAWILARREKKGEALSAYAVAQALLDDKKPASRIPFCRHLIARFLPDGGETEAERKIIAP